MSFALKVHQPPRRGPLIKVETSKLSRNLTGLLGSAGPKPVNLEGGMSYRLRIPAHRAMTKTILSEWLYRYTIIEKTNDVVSFRT
jgi:hypothetical protein